MLRGALNHFNATFYSGNRYWNIVDQILLDLPGSTIAVDFNAEILRQHLSRLFSYSITFNNLVQELMALINLVPSVSLFSPPSPPPANEARTWFLRGDDHAGSADDIISSGSSFMDVSSNWNVCLKCVPFSYAEILLHILVSRCSRQQNSHHSSCSWI